MNPRPGPVGPETESAARRDLTRLLSARALRGFGGGMLSVALALDLARDFSTLVAGVVLGISLAAASAWSVAAERIERRVGRRRAFLVGAVGLALGGWLLFAAPADEAVVLAAVLLGGILAGPSDIGPLPTLEQAALASVVTDGDRTPTFGRYNLLGYLGGSAGALLAAPLTALGASVVGGPHDLVLLGYGLIGLGLVPTYLGLSARVDRAAAADPRAPLSAESRSRIARLSTLFGVDAFGGGLVANFLVTLWLRERYQAPAAWIGAILAIALVGAAVSLVLAVPLARRFGLVRTMVFTHLPSNVLLIAFAFAPNLVAAGGLWIARSLLSQMDVPTRQSYVQAIVTPPERTAAAGYTTAARTTSALGGPVTGALLGVGGPWLAAPFVLAGSVKIAYDGALYAGFRGVRPPEERG